MAFRPSFIPSGMTLKQYADFCVLDQLITDPLEIPPPVRKKAFLSSNELKLLPYLVAWCPNFIVFSQVHLLQMISVDVKDIDATFMQNYEYVFGDDNTKNREKAYWTIFNMVNLLSVDFILADKTGIPVYAIELDGKEHSADLAVIERDKVKAHVLNSICIPLLRVRNSELAVLTSLQTKIVSFAR